MEGGFEVLILLICPHLRYQKLVISDIFNLQKTLDFVIFVLSKNWKSFVLSFNCTKSFDFLKSLELYSPNSLCW